MKKLFFLTALVLLLGAGCQSTSTSTPPTPPVGKEVAVHFDEDLTLGVNDTASFEDGLRVVLTSINDSRCPPDVACIWAGELGATLSLQVGDDAQHELILGTTTRPVGEALGYTFTLVDITEAQVTLKVSK